MKQLYSILRDQRFLEKNENAKFSKVQLRKKTFPQAAGGCSFRGS